MAYNALSQVDHEVASNASISDASDRRSPEPKSTGFEPLAIDFDNLGGSKFMDNAKIVKDTSSISLKSVIRSRGASTASYQIVEDDDYRIVDQERNPHGDQSHSGHRHFQNDWSNTKTKAPSHPSSPEPPLQNSRNKSPVRLRHPTPDLQSIQGAYVGNVERLERSAARLSMDTGEGLDGLEAATAGQNKRRSDSASRYGSAMSRSRGVSIGSLSHPNADDGVVTPSSGYSAGGYTSSPRQSAMASVSATSTSRLRSGSTASRLAKVLEPENENESENPAFHQEGLASSVLPPPPHPFNHETNPGLAYNPNINDAPLSQSLPAEDRPPTAGSGDTYQQATNLFKDFDGVHYAPHAKEQGTIRRVSLTQPPLAVQPEHYNAPNPGQNMVFYPAPVPAILNLPQRLSHKPANTAEHEKRRTQMINSLPPEGRKSAAWLPETERTDEPERPNKRSSNLPPQLRASAFFEQPPTKLDIRVQQNSAVATLDDILDAAAHAPVSAFTDHPIVGHVGSEVYGKSKLKKRKNKNDKDSRASLKPPTSSEKPPSPSGHSDHGFEGPNREAEDESTPFTTSYEDGNNRNSRDRRSKIDKNHSTSEYSGSERAEGEEEDELYVGAPTTLLAELQLRKQEQKQRSRTAATAFPNGMHSTLLELDSVAQRQHDKRNQRHVRLAWEDPVEAEEQEPDDDDVPLAVLFPQKNSAMDENRPLGLMEKLLLEENEPLSHRRARMRGEPLHAAPTPRDPSPDKRASTAYTLDVPGLVDEPDAEEDENETLAQRVRRLKAREEREKNNFADDLLSRFGDQPNNTDNSNGDNPKQAGVAVEEPEEETLGQRRKRLQAEARNRQSTSSLLPSAQTLRRSMTDHSAAATTSIRPTTTMGLQSHPYPQQQHSFQFPSSPMGNHGASMSHLPYQPNSMHPYGNGFPAGSMSQNPYAMSNPSFAAAAHAARFSEPQTMIDPRQRDMIDRWRLSIRQ